MKSEPVTKFLIGGTRHRSICFQSVIKLLTVPISLLTTGKHIITEVFTAFTYSSICFQSIV